MRTLRILGEANGLNMQILDAETGENLARTLGIRYISMSVWAGDDKPTIQLECICPVVFGDEAEEDA